MRLELLLSVEKPMLPKDFKPIFVSYLKNALSQCNEGKYYEKYFGSRDTKDYTFSIILPNPKFEGELIKLGDSQVKLIFSASDKKRTGLIFFAAFIQQKNKRFPLPNGNGMTLKKVNQLREQLIMSRKATFKTTTGGGLLIRLHERDTNKDKYFTFDEEGFDTQMRCVLGTQARQAGFAETVSENIVIRPIQCKKIVAKQFGTYVDATVGIFEMEAEPELLQYFYQAGIGSRHSQGMGMLDLIAQN